MVRLTVGDSFGGNAGHIYILLIDPVTSDLLAWDEADVVGGVYSYQLPHVPAGDYEIVAGTDNDNDFFICDSGEACGLYPTLDSPTLINVDRDIENLDFSMGYILTVPETQSAEQSGEDAMPRATLRPHINEGASTGID